MKLQCSVCAQPIKIAWISSADPRFETVSIEPHTCGRQKAWALQQMVYEGWHEELVSLHDSLTGAVACAASIDSGVSLTWTRTPQPDGLERWEAAGWVEGIGHVQKFTVSEWEVRS